MPLRPAIRFLWAFLALALAAIAANAGAQEPRAAVLSCTLDGTVDAGSAAYLEDCVRTAEAQRAEALLVRVDTPGGSLEATREIVQAFLGSRVPVLVWVGPSGARAGSAGVFITLASNLAGMAPGSNIGAAHPVVGPGGADPEEAGGTAMAEKILNDASAFAESIAKQRGRNGEWAVQAVRESASVPAERALELHVVELLAPTEAAFLDRADGRTVQLPDGPQVLHTAGARIEKVEPSLRQGLVHWLANPTVAYLLFVLGGLGLAIELSHPGGFVPGVVGAIALVLALIAFSALPISAGAIFLLVIGIGLIVAELFVTSGLLGLAGVGLLILGGILLVDRVDTEWFVEPSRKIALEVLIPTAIVVGGAMVFVMFRAAQARREPQRAGDLGLIGEKGRALSPVGREGGEVFVHGERWRAIAPRPIADGGAVVVRGIDGLTLHVEELSE